MDDFYKKWKEDKKYRTKIKLLAYTFFIIIVSIYALSINDNTPNNNINEEKKDDKEIINSNENIITIPKNYTYNINITIDNDNYSYYGKKTPQEEIITKETPTSITNYRYFDNEYYIQIDDIYQKTTKEDVYDIATYNYLNLTNINKYLSKSTKNNNEYWVYLKDVILGNDSNDYFIINLSNNHINIDYTELIKEFNPNISKYLVDIKIESNEWKRWNNVKKERRREFK